MAIRILLAGTAKKGLIGAGTCPPLERALLDEGFQIGNVENSQILISINHNDSIFKKFYCNAIQDKLSFLVLLEPKSVFPSQYSPKILAKYSKCFYPGNRSRQSLDQEMLGWPYLFNENPARPEPVEMKLSDYLESVLSEQIFDLGRWNARANQITMIAANKVSPTNENLYNLRRSLASSLPNESLKLYGPLWSESLLNQVLHRLAVLVFALKSGYRPNLKSLFGALGKSYPAALGEVVNKHAILKDSKFSLVVENSSENITEKLFDSLINGAIPIYIGPDLQYSGIPSGVALQGLSDAKSITEMLENISAQDISQYLRAIEDFLKSSVFEQVWNADNVYMRIASEISETIREAR